MHKPYIFLILLMILNIRGITAQSTSSPYSLFAEGQIENLGSGTNLALGNTGIAFKSHHYLNNLNPASYSDIDSLSFLFEIGIFFKETSYITRSERKMKSDANLSYLALGLRIFPKWGISIGVTPYSSVGYTVHSVYNLEGTSMNYLKTYEGKGGINKYYIGNSFQMNKNLSLGFHISYMMGTINLSETGNTGDYTIAYKITEEYKIHKFCFDYGFQYSFYRDNWKYTIGGIYGNKTKLDVTNEMYINYENDTLDLEVEDRHFIIPEKYGIGIAVQHKNMIMAGIDYEVKRWSSLNNFSNSLLRTRDSKRISAGIEFNPRKYRSDRGLKIVYYRLGASYNRSYLIIDDIRLDSKAVHFGLGIPVRWSLSMINLAFEIGSYGTTENGLIKENYTMIHVNFTLHDIWFQKAKYD